MYQLSSLIPAEEADKMYDEVVFGSRRRYDPRFDPDNPANDYCPEDREEDN